MYCRLGYRQAESCKHWRTFRELRSSENLWPLLCLSWNLIAKIVNPPISHGIRMLRMFCFMTKHTLLGLGCVFLLWTHASGRFGTFCVPKCRTIPFSAVFWNRATSCTPVVAEKCRKNRFGGYGIGGKPHFGRKNVARFEICPENRNRATKFVGSFRGFLSLGRFSRHLPFSILQSAWLRNPCV